MHWTLPLLLTILRVVLILPLIVFLFIPASYAPWCALVIYIIAAITDYLDGRIARQFKLTSQLGACADYTADKLLVCACLLALAATDRLGLAGVGAGLIIILREIFIGGVRELLAGQGTSLPSSKLGKWKTTVQMIAIGMLIIGFDAPHLPMLTAVTFPEIIRLGGHILLLIAGLLTAITWVQYLRRAAPHLKLLSRPQ